MAHITDDLYVFVRWIRAIDQCGASVDVVSAQTINEGFDGVECAFMEDEVAR